MRPEDQLSGLRDAVGTARLPTLGKRLSRGSRNAGGSRNAWERGGKENSRAGLGIGEGWAPDPAEKGRGLQLQFTVEDKQVFTTPWSATKTYRRVVRDWPEQVCAENPHKYGTEKDAAVPTADKPDF